MIREPGERTLREATEDPMDRDSGVITHPKFRIWLRPDGIVQIVWGARTTPLLEDATAALEALSRLTGGRPRPLLVDMRDTGAQDRATRAEWTRRSDLQSATALIVGTSLSRMMGNVFISMGRSPMPARLFDDEASAVAWLKSIVS